MISVARFTGFDLNHHYLPSTEVLGYFQTSLTARIRYRSPTDKRPPSRSGYCPDSRRKTLGALHRLPELRGTDGRRRRTL